VDHDALTQRLRSLVGARSFREIGELTDTHPETARRYLAGQAPSVEFLAAVCRAFGVTAEWLLTGQGPMRRSDAKGHALREASATELLTAIAATLERLIERVDRLELFVQTMETRLRARESEGAGRIEIKLAPDGKADHASAAHAASSPTGLPSGVPIGTPSGLPIGTPTGARASGPGPADAADPKSARISAIARALAERTPPPAD
jgi:transcriptional regulator with XRE-family HTH domain